MHYTTYTTVYSNVCWQRTFLCSRSHLSWCLNEYKTGKAKKSTDYVRIFWFKQTSFESRLIISGNCHFYVKLNPKPSSVLISHVWLTLFCSLYVMFCKATVAKEKGIFTMLPYVRFNPKPYSILISHFNSRAVMVLSWNHVWPRFAEFDDDPSASDQFLLFEWFSRWCS